MNDDLYLKVLENTLHPLCAPLELLLFANDSTVATHGAGRRPDRVDIKIFVVTDPQLIRDFDALVAAHNERTGAAVLGSKSCMQ